MNRKEHLLTILSEECNEVGKRASKTLRFGVYEIQPGQPFNNYKRLRDEIHDFLAVVTMLEDELDCDFLSRDERYSREKKEKVEAYLKHSRTMGTLDDE